MEKHTQSRNMLSIMASNSAEQPVDTIVGHTEARAEQPGDINSAEQPEVTIVGHSESRVEQPGEITVLNHLSAQLLATLSLVPSE